jgi:hypothetical protein
VQRRQRLADQSAAFAQFRRPPRAPVGLGWVDVQALAEHVDDRGRGERPVAAPLVDAETSPTSTASSRRRWTSTASHSESTVGPSKGWKSVASRSATTARSRSARSVSSAANMSRD